MLLKNHSCISNCVVAEPSNRPAKSFSKGSQRWYAYRYLYLTRSCKAAPGCLCGVYLHGQISSDYYKSEDELNPFREKGMPIEKQIRIWKDIELPPFRKQEVDAFTRAA